MSADASATDGAAAPTAHAGTCAIVGLPNVGKSTLLNRILGRHLVAVSPRPQTTRNRILGIHRTVVPGLEPAQVELCFVDTPGIQRGKGALRRFMRDQALGAVNDSDVALLVIDASDRRGRDPTRLAEADAADLADAAGGQAVIVALNKIDRVAKPELLPLLEAWHRWGQERSGRRPGEEADVVPIAGKTGDGVDGLVAVIAGKLPVGPLAFPPDMVTDRAEAFLAAELVREQLYHQLGQELPYAAAVIIESFEEHERGDLAIGAAIVVERESQKAIVIGRGGTRIKELGIAARAVLAELFGCTVHLSLFVKVVPDWTQGDDGLRRLGYGSGVVSRPRVAVVGRPNVGKSTLFNRMVGGRPALVHDRPGLTRDRRYGAVDYFGADFDVIDTGGLDPSAEGEVIGAGIHRQAWRAIDEADLLLLVVDGSAGVAPLDEEVARQIRATGKPIILAVNKIDGPKRDPQVGEFHALGLGEPWAVSAAHGRGVDAMLEAMVAALGITPVHGGDDEEEGDEDGEIDDRHDGDEAYAAHDEGLDEVETDAESETDADAEAESESESETESEDDAEPHKPRHHKPVPVRWPRPADREEADRQGRADAPRGPVRIAFLGKPNAGKSSLTNRLLGEERSLVHHEPGTTTDPVDSPLTFGGREYVLVDTAGVRRKARIEDDVEKLAVSMALGQIVRADVVVLVIDATLGPSEQDARLAGAIADAGKAIILALNKSDLLRGAAAGDQLREAVKDNFHFMPWVQSALLSAARGDGVDRLMDLVNQVAAQHRRRISTAELNRFFAEVCEVVPPPIWRGKSVRIHYITQAAVRPPSFVLMTNQPIGVSPSYQRFLTNQLRKRYGFRGTPLRIFTRARADRHKR